MTHKTKTDNLFDLVNELAATSPTLGGQDRARVQEQATATAPAFQQLESEVGPEEHDDLCGEEQPAIAFNEQADARAVEVELLPAATTPDKTDAAAPDEGDDVYRWDDLREGRLLHVDDGDEPDEPDEADAAEQDAPPAPPTLTARYFHGCWEVYDGRLLAYVIQPHHIKELRGCTEAEAKAYLRALTPAGAIALCTGADAPAEEPPAPEPTPRRARKRTKATPAGAVNAGDAALVEMATAGETETL